MLLIEVRSEPFDVSLLALDAQIRVARQSEQHHVHKLAYGTLGGEALQQVLQEDVLVKWYLRFSAESWDSYENI